MSKERVTQLQRQVITTNSWIIDMEYRKRKEKEKRMHLPHRMTLGEIKARLRLEGYFDRRGKGRDTHETVG